MTHVGSDEGFSDDLTDNGVEDAGRADGCSWWTRPPTTFP